MALLVIRDLLPPTIPTGKLLVGRVVGGEEWTALANLRNHVVGQGRMLVPAYTPQPEPSPVHAGDLLSRENIDPGTRDLATCTYSYAFRLFPSYPAIEREWLIGAYAYLFDDADNTDGVEINDENLGRIELPDGTTFDFDPRNADSASGKTSGLQRGLDGASAMKVRETVSSQTDVTTDVDLQIAAHGHWNVRVWQIACQEVPRTHLDTDSSTDDGVVVTPLQAGQPGLASTMQRVVERPSINRRGRRVLAQHAVPYQLGPSNLLDDDLMNSVVRGNLLTPVVQRGWDVAPADTTFKTILEVPVLGRVLGVGDTTTPIRVDVHCWAVGTVSSFTIQATAASGDSDAWSQAGPASPTWVSRLELNIDAEDLATAGGGAEDTITVEARYNSGTGTVYISTVCIYEDPPPDPVDDAAAIFGLALGGWWTGDSAVFSGSNLTNWADLSANARDLSTVTGTPQTATLGGPTAVSFDGGIQSAQATGTLTPSATDGIMWTVLTADASAAYDQVVFSLDNFDLEIQIPSGTQNAAFEYAGTALTGGSIASASYVVATRTQNGANVDITLRVNGTEVDSATVAAATFSPTRPCLGDRQPVSAPAEATIAEAGFVEGPVALSEVQRLEAYLAAKYGI